MNLIEHFINGKITKGSSKKTSKVFNPATGEQTAEVNLASKSDVDLVVEKAKKAFVDWSGKPPAQRARVIFKFKELIEKNLMAYMSVLCVLVVQLLVQVIGGTEKAI